MASSGSTEKPAKKTPSGEHFWNGFGVPREGVRLYKNVLGLKSNLSVLVDKWKHLFPEMMKAIDEITKKVDSMRDNEEKEKKALGDWQIFIEHCTAFFEKITVLTASEQGEEEDVEKAAEKSLASKLAAISEIAEFIPKLVCSFDRLGLEGLVSTLLPSNAAAMKKEFTAHLSDLVKKTLPDQVRIYSDAVEKRLKAFEAMNLDQFDHLSEINQNVLLMLAATQNHAYKQIYLANDRLEIQSRLRPGAIAEQITLKERSISDHCVSFTRVYQLFLRHTGASEVECYPYEKSIRHQRLKRLKELTPSSEARRQYDEEEKDRITHEWKATKEKCVQLIDDRIKSTSKAKAKLLTEFKTNMQSSNDVLALLHDIKSIKKWDPLFENNSLTKVTMGFVEEACRNTKESIDNRAKQLEQEKERIKKHIIQSLEKKEDEIDADAYVLMEPKKFNFDEMMSELKDEPEQDPFEEIQALFQEVLPRAVDDSHLLIETLLGGRQKKSDSTVKNDALSQLKNAAQWMHQSFKALVDEEVYSQTYRPLDEKKYKPGIFALGQCISEITWPRHVGSALYSIDRAVETLVTLKPIFDTNPNTRRKKVEKSPAENIRHHAEAIHELNGAVVSLIESVNSLSRLPFMSEMSSMQGALSMMQSLLPASFFQSVSTGPFYEMVAGDEGRRWYNQLVSFPNERIHTIMGICDEVTQKIVRYHAQSDQSQLALRHSLALIDGLTHQFIKPAEDPLQPLTVFDMAGIALQQSRRIAELTEHVGLAFGSGYALAKDEFLRMLQEINLLMRDVYCVLDNIEIRLRLKEGVLANLQFLSSKYKSLNHLVQYLDQLVNICGYEFKPRERFPYTEMILAQRIQMRDRLFVDCDEDERGEPVFYSDDLFNFYNRRIQETQQKLQEIEKQKAKTFELSHHARFVLSVKDSFKQYIGKLKENHAPAFELRKEALLYLLSVLKKSGYLLNDAVIETKAKYPQYYNLFMFYDVAFLIKIREEERQHYQSIEPSEAKVTELKESEDEQKESLVTTNQVNEISTANPFPAGLKQIDHIHAPVPALKLEMPDQKNPKVGLLQTHTLDQLLMKQVTLIEEMVGTFEEEIKSILDQRIYRDYFTEQKREMEFDPLSPKALWIQQTGMAVVKLKQWIAALKAQTAHVAPPQDIVEAFEVPKQLVQALFGLSDNPFVMRFTSGQKIKAFVKEMMPFGMITTPGQSKAYQMANSDWVEEIKQAEDKLKAILESKALIQRLPPEYKENANIVKAIEGLSEVLLKLVPAAQEFGKDEIEPKGKLATIGFVLTRFSQILSVVSNLPAASKTLKALLKDQFIVVADELNHVFSDVYLLLDRFEMTFYLQEGILLKKLGIDEHVRAFYEVVSQSGYEFAEPRRYPYADMKLAMRKAIAPTLERQFATDRIHGLSGPYVEDRVSPFNDHPIGVAAFNVEEDSKSISPFDPGSNRLLLVDLAIHQLRKRLEIKFYFFSHYRKTQLHHKLQAFLMLRTYLERPGYNVSDALVGIEARRPDYVALLREEKHLLREMGDERFGKKQIDSELVTILAHQDPKRSVQPDDKKIGQLIDDRTTALEHEKNAAWFKSSYVHEIALLNELKGYLIQGYSVDVALRKVSTISESKAYISLLYHGQSFDVIKQLRNDELPREYLFNRTQVEILALKKQVSKHTWFYRSWNESIANRQRVLTAFEGHLKVCNTIDVAMQRLNEADRAVLNAQEKLLLKDLRAWEAAHQPAPVAVPLPVAQVVIPIMGS